MFGGFVQFQIKYFIDEVSIQEIFSIYFQTWSQVSLIEFLNNLKTIKISRWEDYNNDSEEEFGSNYDIADPNKNKDKLDGSIEADMAKVANALINHYLFEELSFMHALNLDDMHALAFPKYLNPLVVEDCEFSIGMEFSSREAMIMAIKDYTIHKSVDYRGYKSEPMTFYAKCMQYGTSCDSMIRVNMIHRKYYWVIRIYSGIHTCIRATIFQDHSKLYSNTIVEAIRPLVEADLSIKSKFNYTISYHKVWLAKQKTVEKFSTGRKLPMKFFPDTLKLCITKSHQQPSILKLWTHMKGMT
ncbi:hypothetical protein Ahy_B10g103987 [Arachis hypogaea]|uniref:Uncharacterized protein n=1 Tax=Arachis hypogaea TaxID=3818 RepID=A0A444X4G5_ARAHY|nr:hypothetical protein Ahy_B10g103987 [Arachis hypogaea]